MLQKEPSNYERQLVALGRALQALREEKTADAVVKATLDYLQAEFDYALIWLGLYDRVEHRLMGKGGVCPQGDASLLKQRISLNPGDLLEQVVIQQRPLGIPDLRDEPRAGDWRRVAQKHNIQGAVLFPIRYKDRCFGVVLLGSLLWGTSPHAEEKARLSMILGTLAETLYQLETEQQRQQAKRPDQPLLSLLHKLRALPSLSKRLEAVVEETHHFIAPHRTNVYWYEPEQRYFWRRVGHRDKTAHSAEADENSIWMQEVGGFYQALSADQLVAIGEARSSLKADVTERLMQQIQARSLIAAPILYQGELLGFLTVEGNEARIWLEEEKNYVRGAAQLIALTAPLEVLETTIQQVRGDQALTAEVTHALYSEDDWRTTLRRCAEQVLQRFKAERFLVLLHNPNQKTFTIYYQHQVGQRRPVAAALDPLNPVDWQMLERSTEAVGIENLQDDLKLMAWRSVFLDLELRSLLVCSTSIGKPLEGLLVVGHEATRSWSRAERELLKVVSQQIGLLLHQLQLQLQTAHLQTNYQSLQWGLTTLRQIQQLEPLERTSTQQIAHLLQAPLVALLTWRAGQTVAQITAPVVAKSTFAVATDVDISLFADPLLQEALHHDGLLIVRSEQLTPETRQWLTGSEIGQVLVFPLHTAPEHEPTGIVLAADHAERVWSEQQLNTLGMLIQQLSWSRRYLMTRDTLLEQRTQLEQLNWYKQRHLEESYRILSGGVRRLNELSHQKDAFSTLRCHQVLRHLSSTLSSGASTLKQEQWQLQSEYETISLASLLKRGLERLDGLIKQRQLWSQVHNDANVCIGGDVVKIEFILYEILMAACQRSPVGARLDIWCRQMDARWLELSITDNGVIEPQLMEALETGRSGDLLAPSVLDHPPGLHLAICQSLMQHLGGECTFCFLEDGRVLSRLMLPIAVSPPVRQSPRKATELTSGFF
ncbi:MAG: GAF domain-containing protein [Synechococcales cyanobacterium C42_A2020_086]|jgi:GAF domain-containing protein|nr:GAF domain-containing protein [Synechococcales cyanobacterium C42_A2020_086]